MLNINVLADYFFANNVGLYINSQQTINTTVDIHSTSTDINPNLTYCHANMDECPKRNPCYATFARKLAK